ncbi:uncharacterized protein LOC129942509 [Eupeodes corollae]|uniref:uncharacterized protein LOC129942509 n=1 Tax=Eupeodes corollae TaxID=290404 RepID=UPI002493864D|nr:uncharacterized protein LOC129942509 [Eupeodes corollae]
MDLQLDRESDVPAPSSPTPTLPPKPRPPSAAGASQAPPLQSSEAVRMGACMGRCIADKSSCLKRWRSTDEHETELMTDEEEDDSKTQRRKNKERKHIFRIIKFRRKNRKQFVDKFMERQDLNYSRLSKTPTTDLTDIQLQSLDAQTLLVTAAANNVTTTNTFVPAVSSRTSSSLDLEWEHEYGQHNHHHSNSNRGLSRSWLFIDGAEADTNGDIDGGETSDDNKPLFNSPPSDDSRGVILGKQHLNRAFNDGQLMTSQMAKSNSNLQQQHQQQQQSNFTRTSSRTSWSHISTPESLEWDIDEDQTNRMRLEDDNLDHETLELLHQIEMLKNKVLNETGDGLDGIEFPSNGGDS